MQKESFAEMFFLVLEDSRVREFESRSRSKALKTLRSPKPKIDN
jgi:hypothetical protein